MTGKSKTPVPGRQRVLLGVVSGVHGIRGDLVIRSYTADPGDIASYGALESAAGQTLPALLIVRFSAKGVIAHMMGVDDRNAAEALKGTELWIERARLPAAVEGEYYHADLIGLDAVSPEGAPIGTVIAVENFGAGDLLEIRLAGGTRTEFVSFTNAFVPEIDLAAGRAVVLMPAPGDDDDDGDHELERDAD